MVTTGTVEAQLAQPSPGVTDAVLLERAWRALSTVMDPEVPVVSIVELGIVRDVRLDGPTLVIEVTPTYSGCPATETIIRDIDDALDARGVSNPRIETTLAPAWSTDRIAPPHVVRPRVDVAGISPLRRATQVMCPRCGSFRTKLVSQFGSTACKAHYRCENCLEPFDYFKAF